jgi:hypothetical protein
MARMIGLIFDILVRILTFADTAGAQIAVPVRLRIEGFRWSCFLA